MLSRLCFAALVLALAASGAVAAYRPSELVQIFNASSARHEARPASFRQAGGRAARDGTAEPAELATERGWRGELVQQPSLEGLWVESHLAGGLGVASTQLAHGRARITQRRLTAANSLNCNMQGGWGRSAEALAKLLWSQHLRTALLARSPERQLLLQGASGLGYNSWASRTDCQCDGSYWPGVQCNADGVNGAVTSIK